MNYVTVTTGVTTVRSLSPRPMHGIGDRQNWNSCVRWQQHSSITYEM